MLCSRAKERLRGAQRLVAIWDERDLHVESLDVFQGKNS